MNDFVIIWQGKIFCAFHGRKGTRWVTSLQERSHSSPRFPPAIYTLEEARDVRSMLARSPYLLEAKIHPVRISEDPLE